MSELKVRERQGPNRESCPVLHCEDCGDPIIRGDQYVPLDPGNSSLSRRPTALCLGCAIERVR